MAAADADDGRIDCAAWRTRIGDIHNRDALHFIHHGGAGGHERLNILWIAGRLVRVEQRFHVVASSPDYISAKVVRRFASGLIQDLLQKSIVAGKAIRRHTKTIGLYGECRRTRSTSVEANHQNYAGGGIPCTS